MDENQQKIREKIILLQKELEEIYLRLEAIRQEDLLLQRLEYEYSTAKETLQRLSEVESEEEALFPIGGGIYIKARIIDKDKVLANVGADVFIEYSFSETIKKLEDSLNTVQKRRKELIELSTSLSKRAESIREELVKISETLKEG